MQTLIQDLRLAVRAMRRAPGFTLVAVLTLALGIGANTAIFSVLYGVLLRPLPYPDSDRLVQLAVAYQGRSEVLDVTWRQYRSLVEQSAPFADMAATTHVGFNIFADGAADRVDGLRVSAGYFTVLGVQPALGRGFTTDEDQPGGPSAVVLSHGYWQRRFGGDPEVVGRTVSVDGEPYTVVGVMPASFRSLPAVDAWSTLAQVGRTIGSGQNLEMIGRLRPGVTLAQARARLEGLVPAFREEFRQSFSPELGLDLLSYQALVVQDVRTPVRVLFGAIGFVLLIACANVANLVLGRTTARGRELAMRVALGATRGRLVRQLLTESVALALVGGAAGLLLAYWSMGLLTSLVAGNLPRAGEIRLDGWALAFTFGVALATGVAFGLMPAWQGARTDLNESLKEGGRTTDSTRRGRLRGALVVAEVALSLVLLVGAGLLIETFTNLVRTDGGFERGRLVTAEIWLTGSRYDSTAAIGGFYGELTRRLEAVPGVQSAAVVEAGLPLQRGGNMPATVDGAIQPRSVDYRTVTPGYFGTLGVRLLAGRLLTDADGAGGEPVAVVSQVFAQRMFPDSNALGHLVRIGGETQATRRIVGVVSDVRSFVGLPPQPATYLPSAQTPAGYTRVFGSWFPIHVVVRTAVDPATMREAVRRTIHETDAQIPVGRVRTMDEVLAGSLAFQRLLMLLISLFAGLAAALAAIGLYGVMSYLVTQRTHEIGVRMALGAVPGDVRRMVIRRGMALALVGVGLGLAGALALTRLLQNQLYEVKATDPQTFGAVALLLTGVALVACLVPALRATRVDPMVALRGE